MESLAVAIETEYQISVRVICPIREKERITCGWRYCSPWRRRTGTGTSEIKECKKAL